MDVESDRKQNSFIPSEILGTSNYTNISATDFSTGCSNRRPMDEIYFLAAAGIIAIANIAVIITRERLADFQTTLFRVSMLTGWVLLQLSYMNQALLERNEGYFNIRVQ